MFLYFCFVLCIYLANEINQNSSNFRDCHLPISALFLMWFVFLSFISVFFADHFLSFCRFICRACIALFSFIVRLLNTPLVSSDFSFCVWILFHSYFVSLQQLMAYKLSKPTYQFICTLYLSYNHSIGEARINFILMNKRNININHGACVSR